MARLTGFEPVTIRLEGGCSIQLSYRRITDDIESRDFCLEKLVGAVGFEPTTPWSQTRCTTRLCYAPISTLKVGVNDGIRTRDNWNHNPGLYQLSYIHHHFDS